MSSTVGQIEISIRNKLHETLQATQLEIINESHLHNTPPGSETHFKIVVVSKKFEDLPSLKVPSACHFCERHKLVNDTLREEFRTSIRALSIVAKTPDEWAAAEKAEQSSSKRRSSFGFSHNQMSSAEDARWP